MLLYFDFFVCFFNSPVTHEMPFFSICLLPCMCVLGNLPPFTKKILTPKRRIAIPINTMQRITNFTVFQKVYANIGKVNVLF